LAVLLDVLAVDVVAGLDDGIRWYQRSRRPCQPGTPRIGGVLRAVVYPTVT